jgi:hypothetical protein
MPKTGLGRSPRMTLQPGPTATREESDPVYPSTPPPRITLTPSSQLFSSTTAGRGGGGAFIGGVLLGSG